MQTKAAVYVEFGKPMVIDDIQLPDPGPTQVEVRLFASGICHSQLHQLGRPNSPVPMVLGHEATGVVTRAGREVTYVQPGDHVMMGIVQRNILDPVQPVVAHVTYRGQEVTFGGPTYIGMYTWCEHTVVDQQMLVKFDKDLATDVTSIVGCAVLAGAGAALNAAQVRAGQSVAVFGGGGVGLSIVQACANSGASPIIVVDLADDKLDFARQFGATVGVNASKVDPVAAIREIMGGTPLSGVDFAFDAIGLATTSEQALQATRGRQIWEREGGTAVIVGVPHGPPAVPDLALISHGRVMRGAPGGIGWPERDYPRYLQWYRDGKLPLDRLVSQRFTLDQVNEACDALQHGQIAGRAIIEYGDGGNGR
ncbi:MAG TPA: zinc-binding dehydrogenase [Chloroflexota bacterium]